MISLRFIVVSLSFSLYRVLYRAESSVWLHHPYNTLYHSMLHWLSCLVTEYVVVNKRCQFTSPSLSTPTSVYASSRPACCWFGSQCPGMHLGAFRSVHLETAHRSPAKSSQLSTSLPHSHTIFPDKRISRCPSEYCHAIFRQARARLPSHLLPTPFCRSGFRPMFPDSDDIRDFLP